MTASSMQFPIIQSALPSATGSNLSAALHASALALVHDICTRAMEHDFTEGRSMHARSDVALLLAAACIAFREDAYGTRAIELMDDALAGLEVDNHSLFSGAPGLIWKAVELDALMGVNEYGPIAADYDEVLADMLSAVPHWTGHFELINGLTGVGVYAFSRRADGHRNRIQDDVLKQLSAMAIWTNDGCYWLTKSSMLPPGIILPSKFSDCFIDLGIAHGNAGVIALLAAIVEQEPTHAEGRTLLSAAVTWYVAQKRSDRAQGLFGCRVDDNATSRGAWCYGDFSAAWALFGAGRALHDTRLEEFALELLVQASARSDESLSLADPWLCHGYAGVAHLARRVALAYDKFELMLVAQRYFASSVDLTRELVNSVEPDWSLLEGMVGTCFACLDACGLISRRWDRLLLVA